jgi:hypothetical protein
MQVKINDKIFSVPPYLSTDWSRIGTIHIKGGILAVTLKDGDTINIPNLSQDVIEQIFSYHAAYLENETTQNTEKMEVVKQVFIPLTGGSIEGLPFNNIDGMGIPMQHNPEQSDAPNLPPEILEKISVISRMFNQDEAKQLAQPVPACNCFHCQILKALHPQVMQVAHIEDVQEDISDEDLQFQQWIITQKEDKLFSVTNKLDTHETYNVYLGTPVGCTCGQEGCEHILAVLKS